MVIQKEPMRVKSLFRSLLVFALAAYRKKMNLHAELEGRSGRGWIDGKGLF